MLIASLEWRSRSMHWSWSWPLVVLEGWVDGWHVVALHSLRLHAGSSGSSRSSLH